ncbi:hypothetical protein CRG98_045383 [Punica granatum]|uniref:Uncharacterized protein n=1 Tax=Punica granatum TaxID=22663 RepID=A0A2I0HSJ0_PUNGR|nr:hypothetical protein CRG98_045383 [Punica granatum]
MELGRGPLDSFRSCRGCKARLAPHVVEGSPRAECSHRGGMIASGRMLANCRGQNARGRNARRSPRAECSPTTRGGMLVGGGRFAGSRMLPEGGRFTDHRDLPNNFHPQSIHFGSTPLYNQFNYLVSNC